MYELSTIGNKYFIIIIKFRWLDSEKLAAAKKEFCLFKLQPDIYVFKLVYGLWINIFNSIQHYNY